MNLNRARRWLAGLLALALTIPAAATAAFAAEMTGEDAGCAVSFETDGTCSIDIYYTQDYTAADETNVTTAWARSSSTGEIDASGDGQVNFLVVPAEGYEIESVTAAGSNYKNLKDSTATGVEKLYRLTKVTGAVTVTVTTMKIGDGGAWSPENLAVNVGGSEDQLLFTWYDTAAAAGTLIFDGTSYTAQVSAASKEGYYINQVTVDGLEESTSYSYVITSGGKTSDTYTCTTGTFGGSFTFAAVGDPQIGASGSAVSDTEGWAATVSAIKNDSNDYAFLFSLGDQVNAYYNGENGEQVENEYTAFLSVFSTDTLPLAVLLGNHDAGQDNSTLYTEHYAVPNVTAYGENQAGDGDYYFTYNNVLFLVLNSSNLSIAEHKQFMEETLEANSNYDWTIVCFHKSIYSVASHVTESDIEALRSGLSPILAELGIDLVLQGHDHVYARSYVMSGETGMEAQVTQEVETLLQDPEGVVYVTLNSASGSKYYNITNEAFTYTAVQNQEKTPNYSAVTVTEDTLTVTTYRANDGSVVDTFTIAKSGPQSPFADVQDSESYFYDAVLWGWANGVTNGVSAGVFAPNGGCTRAMIVTMLWRLAGEPEPTITVSPFVDVQDAGRYWYKAVLWAYEKGVTLGTSADTFSPNGICTRGQLITFLYRWAGAPAVGAGSTGFEDVPTGSYFYNAVCWAETLGVTDGVSAAAFSPNAACTRAQTITFLYRFLTEA